jgi:hypothetical protein
MTVRTGHGRVIDAGAIDGREPARLPAEPPARLAEAGLAAGGLAAAALLRRRSAQPSRRAVLHVRADGDPDVPADVAAWYAERAFHCYVADLALPERVPLAGRGAPASRRAARALAAAFAGLDAACACLRRPEGMDSVIVTGHGRGAVAAALWRDLRGPGSADALILYAPALAARARLSLGIDCPVLVLSDAVGPPAPGGLGRRGPGRRALVTPRRAGQASQPGPQLGGHVTWLRLAPGDGPQGMAEGADRRVLLREVGRWLGAYMYGQARDQLL